MKKNILKFSVIVSLASFFVLSGCTNKFDEINTDPDALVIAPPTNILADVLMGSGVSGFKFGDNLDLSDFTGHIVKIQYINNYSDLIPTNNSWGNRWAKCYRNNTQLKVILQNTEEQPDANKNIRFVARIWQNYMWSFCTDAFRDIPYSEALKGAVEEGAILKAKYDKQEDIYPSIMASLKQIADEMAEGVGTDDIGEGDFIYDGKILKWQKFCNSLRLRMAIRISGVAPELAKSTIEEICGNPAKYPFIDDTDSQCYMNWQGSEPFFEPYYNNKRTRDDYGMSEIFIDHLKEMNDPRLAVVAKPAETDGEYRGFQNGALSQPTELGSISRIGTLYREDPKGFSPYYKASESFFNIAEAAMLGYRVGMTAQEAYEKAVTLSMKENGLTEDDARTYLAGKAKWDNTKERIWWEEWVALFKENEEAWALYRRTGIPSTHYVPLRSVYGTAHTSQPFRLPYPDNEYKYNKDNLDVALQGVEDYCWGKPMWWDTRNAK